MVERGGEGPHVGVVRRQLNGQLSLSTIGLPGIGTQVITLNSKCLYLLSHLAGLLYLISVNLNLDSHAQLVALITVQILGQTVALLLYLYCMPMHFLCGPSSNTLVP